MGKVIRDSKIIPLFIFRYYHLIKKRINIFFFNFFQYFSNTISFYKFFNSTLKEERRIQRSFPTTIDQKKITHVALRQTDAFRNGSEHLEWQFSSITRVFLSSNIGTICELSCSPRLHGGFHWIIRRMLVSSEIARGNSWRAYEGW